MEEKVIENKDEDGEISLKDIISIVLEYYRYLLSKWLIIVSLGLLGGVLGFFYAKSKKPVYTATTTFVLEDGDKGGGGLGQYGALASMAGIDLGGGGGGIFQGDNILELYKSRTMIEKTLLTQVQFDNKKQLLVDRYIESNDLRKSWSEKPELKNINFTLDSKHQKSGYTRLQDSVLGAIVTNINTGYLKVLKPDKKLGIIRVDVSAGDESFAKVFNDQIVKNVNDFYIQTKTKKSLDNIAILQQKTDSVRSVLNGAIYTAAIVADETPNLNPTRQVQRIAPIQRSQFNAETNKIVLSELVKNLEMSKMGLLKETPLIQVIDQPIFPLYMERFGKAKGIILGGIILGFLTVMFLILKKIFKNLVV